MNGKYRQFRLAGPIMTSQSFEFFMAQVARYVQLSRATSSEEDSDDKVALESWKMFVHCMKLRLI